MHRRSPGTFPGWLGPAARLQDWTAQSRYPSSRDPLAAAVPFARRPIPLPRAIDRTRHRWGRRRRTAVADECGTEAGHVPPWTPDAETEHRLGWRRAAVVCSDADMSALSADRRDEELGNHVERRRLCCFGTEGVAEHVRRNRRSDLAAEPRKQIVERMEFNWFAKRRPIVIHEEEIRVMRLPTCVSIGSVPRRGLRTPMKTRCASCTASSCSLSTTSRCIG